MAAMSSRITAVEKRSMDFANQMLAFHGSTPSSVDASLLATTVLVIPAGTGPPYLPPRFQPQLPQNTDIHHIKFSHSLSTIPSTFPPMQFPSVPQFNSAMEQFPYQPTSIGGHIGVPLFHKLEFPTFDDKENPLGWSTAASTSFVASKQKQR